LAKWPENVFPVRGEVPLIFKNDRCHLFAQNASKFVMMVALGCVGTLVLACSKDHPKSQDPGDRGSKTPDVPQGPKDEVSPVVTWNPDILVKSLPNEDIVATPKPGPVDIQESRPADYFVETKEESFQNSFFTCTLKGLGKSPLSVWVPCGVAILQAAPKCSSYTSAWACSQEVPKLVEKCGVLAETVLQTLQSCGSLKPPLPLPQPSMTPTPPTSTHSEVRVLFFGDSGKGTQEQFQLAASMKSYCLLERCDFGLLLGDNFYQNGVTSVNDPKFKTYFEDPYGPLGIPFYVALGNHDYGMRIPKLGSIPGLPLGGGNTQAQIDYSQRSPFWKMPAKYYQSSLGRDGLIEVFALDTNTFAGDTEQQTWLGNALRYSKATWKIVFGHHPIYSYGVHGNTPGLEAKLLPILCQNQIPFYLSGHDHDLQVLQSGCSVTLAVSGASSALRPVNSGPNSLFSSSTFGFSMLKLSAQRASLKMIGLGGRELYDRTVSKE
jgi:tartrate-resistant acid phosphatase type 5